VAFGKKKKTNTVINGGKRILGVIKAPKKNPPLKVGYVGFTG